MGVMGFVSKLTASFIALISILGGYIYLNQDATFEFLVLRTFNQYPYGTLCLKYNGGAKKLGLNAKPNSKCDATMILNNSTAFFRTLATGGGSIGLGEAYFEGMWETDKKDKQSLSTVVYHILKNSFNNANKANIKRRIQFFINNLVNYKTFYHYYQRLFEETKTLENDVRDIEYHYDKGYTFGYDISTEFWESYLGPTRSGSCAIWSQKTKNLEDAQNNKWSIIINKLEIKKSETVLDVGSGWGYLCSKLNNDTGASCQGITLSRDQLEASRIKWKSQLCSTRSKQEKKEKGCIQFKFLDYRKSAEEFGKESFDKVVSVGMVEHVGYKRIQEYFDVLSKVLKYNGKMLIHGITMDDVYPNYLPVSRNGVCKNPNFVSKYIFPGGCIMHPDYMTEAAQKANLIIMHKEHYGQHYAVTLNVWLQNMRRNWPTLTQKNNLDERFFKLHEFYFTFCEAVFRTGRCELTHFLFIKPETSNNNSYDSTFYYRDMIKNPNTC